MAAAAPVDEEEELEEVEEPEVLLLDFVEAAVLRPEEVEPVVVAVETADELPLETAEPELVDDNGTTGEERPAGIDAAGA